MISNKDCSTCWWNEEREEQAPCAYCGHSYGEYNQYRPLKSDISNINIGVSEAKIQQGDKDVFYVSWNTGNSSDYFYHRLRHVIEREAEKLAFEEITQYLPCSLEIFKEKTRAYTRKNLNNLLLKMVEKNLITLNNGIYDKR